MRAREVARRAAATGVPLVTLVPGVIYGPGTETEGNLVGRLIRDHLAGRLPGVVGAGRIWSYSYIDDVAEAHVAALSHGDVGAEYVVGGDNAPQMRIFELLQAKTGALPPRRIPAWIAYAWAWAEEMGARGGRPPRLTRGTVKILDVDWPLDSARTIEELSYRITPLADGANSLFSAIS